MTGVSWNRAQLFSWLDRTEPMVDKLTPFELLEIPPTASGQHIQRAFHAIAATRHPDVWRNHLDARERERLLHVYGRVAGAYATLRNEEARARVLRQVREKRPSEPPVPTAASDRDYRETTDPGSSGVHRRLGRPTVGTDPPNLTPPVLAPTPPAAGAARRPTAPPPTDAPAPATHATLGARAIGFYRRAEAALRVGDVAGALLNLRMALAAEPASQFLKDAIVDAQRRLKK